VKRAIRSAPKGRTKDLDGVRFEHLQGILTHGGEIAGKFFTLLFETMARHPATMSTTISKARSVGVYKKDGSIRPIGITSVLRRIWGKTILLEHGETFKTHLTERCAQATQLAVGARLVVSDDVGGGAHGE
jgi:hypothetical protein